MFGFLKRKRPESANRASQPKDPLAAFDALIEELERQAATIRKSAATLLALRSQLQRDVERYREKTVDLDARIERAGTLGDAKTEKVLRRDAQENATLLSATQENLDRTSGDAELLTEAAEELLGRIGELRVERTSAVARIQTSTAVTDALKQKLERFDQVMAVDQARDEIERAHALAELYREKDSG